MENILSALEGAKISESGVSFAGKSLKLNTSEDAEEVVKEINKCKKLEYLNMEGNTVGIDAAKSIGEALETHPEFKRALWKDMFTGRMKTEIPKALEHLGHGLVKAGSRLTELDLSDNAFGPIGVEGLAALLRSSSCYQLEELKLNNNGLGITGGKLLASALTTCYNSSKSQGKPLQLKVFIAGRNRLENDGAKALSEVFKLIKTLEVVAMPQNGIYFPGITALSEAFNENKNLKVINLNDNTIGPKGAAALSKTLPNLTELTEINFGDCLLKTAGAKSLASALTKNNNLTEITLGFNEIRKEGGIEIAKALCSKPKLKQLIMDGNQFGKEGREEITQILKSTGKLNALGSLDEDESDNSDEEEENSDEEVADSPNESDDEKPPTTIEEFIKNPTEENFMRLGDERKNIILKETKKKGEIVPDEFMPLLMKISALYSSKKEMTRNYVLDISETLYKELILYGTSKNQLALIDNLILVNLGLIKSEDKKFKPQWDVQSCISVIKAIRDQKYIPESTKNTLTVFLHKT